MNWHNPNDFQDPSPDWGDTGRKVEILLDGEIQIAKLEIHDVCSDGEGDEYPIWMFKLQDGREISFFDVELWCFLS